MNIQWSIAHPNLLPFHARLAPGISVLHRYEALASDGLETHGEFPLEQ